ncbi:MAG: Na+/H+ antiporter subunit E [Desulfamplus sp.]|nr:Na+/H+ antiporter subunit E [Desulfamplus sp.]
MEFILKTQQRAITFFITFAILFLFWVIFSGKFDAFHLSLGLISCLLVSWITSDLLIVTHDVARFSRLFIGFTLYIPWLIWQIVLSTIHMIPIILSPDIESKINPKIIKIKSRIRDQVGLVTFANSITLTPGTITVALNTYGDMAVHAIDDECASSLPGDMGDKVARLFAE